tara:strand:+ start:1100 stop:1468 length:369 start_codon:yes stop_codon:yes gene_type:complete
VAVRKVNHSRRILSKKSTTISKAGFRDIIEFKYSAKDIYDKTPMVFVLGKNSKVLTAINISYLKEYVIEQLLEETNPKKLKSWPLCDKAYRTYKISDIKVVKLIEYETLSQRKERLKIENAD